MSNLWKLVPWISKESPPDTPLLHEYEAWEALANAVVTDLTPDANILFASDSIFDILGYQPDEVQGKSCFDYFHPKEVPFARSIHRRGVLLDKAAVLHYARILARNGEWVSCECCFTVVHDVLVACTSIYLKGTKSESRYLAHIFSDAATNTEKGRAIDAPQIRRIFSSSPRDPRYHMLEHLSPKFKMPAMEHEPRAALILNRFTRNLSIMFATNAVTSILGLRPHEIKDKAFYEIIQENCLQNAIQCLESAKANESIAYLRFNYRDPRLERGDGPIEESEDDQEEENEVEWQQSNSRRDSASRVAQLAEMAMDVDGDESGQIDDPEYQTGDRNPVSSTALMPRPSATIDGSARARPMRSNGQGEQGLELEAVVSCTSDGLVVVLRRARPPIPNSHLPLIPAFNFENGMCAAPWAQRPIEPYVPPELLYTFRPPLRPQFMPLRESVKAAGGPPIDQALRSIREAAVFAWPLTGINGSLAEYSHGRPTAGAQPPDGLPIWDPTAGPTEYQGPENRVANRHHRGTNLGSTYEPPRLSYRPDVRYGEGDAAPSNYSHGLGHQDAATSWPILASGSTTNSCGLERDMMPRPFAHTALPFERRTSPHTAHPTSRPAVESSLTTQLPVEPWVEAVRSRGYNQSYTVPSPRASSPTDSSPQDNRYLW